MITRGLGDSLMLTKGMGVVSALALIVTATSTATLIYYAISRL